MSEKIINDGAALGKRINQTLKMYASAGNRIHTDFVSALWHVAKHGNAFYLNRIYSALRSNDQQAARLYLRRAAAIVGLEGANPDGLDAEIIKAAVEKGSVVKITKDEIVVVNGHTSEQAKMLAVLCEERFINPDGETDKRLLDRNNFAEIKTLGDTQVLENLLRIVKQVEDGSTDNRTVQVSQFVTDFLKEIRDKAEVIKSQLSLAEA